MSISCTRRPNCFLLLFCVVTIFLQFFGPSGFVDAFSTKSSCGSFAKHSEKINVNFNTARTRNFGKGLPRDVCDLNQHGPSVTCSRIRPQLQRRRSILSSNHEAFAPEESDKNEARRKGARRSLLKRILVGRRRRKVAAFGLALLTTWSTAFSSNSPGLLRPKAASAAVMFQPDFKREKQDFRRSALDETKKAIYERLAAEEKMARAKFNQRAQEILEKEGPEAKEAFEKMWLEKRRQKQEARLTKKRKVVWDMLNDNIDPNGVIGTQILFKRLYKIDLREIPNTEQFRYAQMQEVNEKRYNDLLAKEQAATKKEIESLKGDNVDVVGYFIKVGDLMDSPIGKKRFSTMPTPEIIKMFAMEKQKLQDRFRDEGRSNPKRDYTVAPGSEEEIAANAKLEKERARLEKKKESERLKQEKKAEKQRLKEQKKLEKAEAAKAKKDKNSKKKKSTIQMSGVAAGGMAMQAAGVASGVATQAETIASDVATAVAEAPDSKSSDGSSSPGEAKRPSGYTSDDSGAGDVLEGASEEEGSSIVAATNDKAGGDTTKVQSSKKKMPALPITTVAKVVGAAGAGGVIYFGGNKAYSMYKQKSEEEEKERQRKFNLIMGVEKDEDEPSDEVNGDLMSITDEISSFMTEPTEKATSAKKEVESTPEPPKKKKRGMLGSIFKKQSASNRETSFEGVFSESKFPSTAKYSQLLSKCLAVGAPGRFSYVEAMSLDDKDASSLSAMMSDEEGFKLEAAKETLIARKQELDISDVDTAEAFANVVNVMIIDLVDLASSAVSMGGNEDEKNTATVDALNVVLDFMDHAASLFDAVAQDVTITPVTYGGTLGSKKLEKMFSAYAVATMTSLDERAQDRLDTLQQVFSIKDKKAEGLLQKVMMKNLMKMMKDGGDGEGGMEGLAEMMSAMGGGAGGMDAMMPDLANGGEDISPEELKQSVEMMKQLVESGSVSKEELTLVRKQFKDAYGADISELIAAADNDDVGNELGDDGKELLNLFKSVLGE